MSPHIAALGTRTVGATTSENVAPTNAGPPYRVQIRHGSRTGETLVDDRIPMPEVFCLETNYEETAKCLAGIRATLRENALRRLEHGMPVRLERLPIYYDFTPMKYCSPAAALVLASEYDAIRAVLNWEDIPVIDLDKWDRGIRQLLEQIGFFKLLSIRVPRTAPTPRRIIRFRTGEMTASEEASALTSTLAGMLAKAQRRRREPGSPSPLYGVLVEATENTRLHAYPDKGDQLMVRHWWMTGAVDRKQRHLDIVAYDHGMSIPATLPNSRFYPAIYRGLSLLFPNGNTDQDDSLDAARIRLAMSAPRSSTGLSHRGKGFPAFKDVIQECTAGRLRILSRRGEFMYEKGRKARSRVLTTPLNGTLVEWNLSL